MCDGAGYQGDIVVTLQLADKNSVCCKVFQHIRQMRPVWPGRGSCSSSPHKWPEMRRCACTQRRSGPFRLMKIATWHVTLYYRTFQTGLFGLSSLPYCGPAPQQNLTGPMLSNWPFRLTHSGGFWRNSEESSAALRTSSGAWGCWDLGDRKSMKPSLI